MGETSYVIIPTPEKYKLVLRLILIMKLKVVWPNGSQAYIDILWRYHQPHERKTLISVTWERHLLRALSEVNASLNEA